MIINVLVKWMSGQKYIYKFDNPHTAHKWLEKFDDDLSQVIWNPSEEDMKNVTVRNRIEQVEV